MPNITKEQAIQMYARFLVARHKHVAGKVACEKATSLLSKGDLDGHKIWSEVADAADRLSHVSVTAAS
jgi:hypothetical protein